MRRSPDRGPRASPPCPAGAGRRISIRRPSRTVRTAETWAKSFKLDLLASLIARVVGSFGRAASPHRRKNRLGPGQSEHAYAGLALFPAPEARRLANRFEWHYTPKHGSWLDMAESELAVLATQCLSRRIPDKQTLEKEVVAWKSHPKQTPRQSRPAIHDRKRPCQTEKGSMNGAIISS